MVGWARKVCWVYISRVFNQLCESEKMESFAIRKNTLHLDGGRVLVTSFRSTGLVPFVDLQCHESMQSEVLHLRIYSTEFENLRSAIRDFIDYMQLVHDQGNVELVRMPVSVMQRADPVMRAEGGSFLIDCSRSHIWLLVRFRPGVRNDVRPKTVTEKEREFPIQLAFKVEDFPKMGNLLKEIDLFFTQEKRKQLLLEKRLTRQSENSAGRQSVSGYKRRINLFSEPEDVKVDALNQTASVK